MVPGCWDPWAMAGGEGMRAAMIFCTTIFLGLSARAVGTQGFAAALPAGCDFFLQSPRSNRVSVGLPLRGFLPRVASCVTCLPLQRPRDNQPVWWGGVSEGLD